jgi:membrane-associated phospholipid phosphatase
MLLVAAAVCAVFGGLFAKLGAEVTAGELASVDHAVREVARQHNTPAGYAFFDAFSAFGSKPAFILIGALVGWFVSNRSAVLVLLIVGSGIVSRVVVHILKDGFGVVRPPFANAQSLSFPSGHVTGVAAIGVVLTYVAWRNSRWPRVVTWTSALVLALMAFSRVYLDKHWFSDTLGGVLIGSAIGLVTCAVYEWTVRHTTSVAAARKTAVHRGTD